ncbi:phage baseplate assembly protein V [Mucilaginibacter sp. cycad4]|uniref:type VI secretion system Vgr family protein n=1 Tax=Mucilaginibacter sp. cycad4 TaxID=3342096 RepID=UPI002AABAFE4|nr:phage baseplate assembly protein V [Mucilaginibacter gossypii]WPU97478.1 phage baseplate assembly protein V [Mucilaginibacter gossypii]
MEKKLKVDINIEGTQITHFSTFNLDQRFNEHHTFQLRFNHDMVEEYNAVTLENSKDFIGKNITVQFGTADSGENKFSGIVTRVELSQSHGFHGDILVSGFSPTILIDRGPDLGSYLNKSLSSIIQLATQDAPANDLNLNIKPTNTSPIDYIIQYRESDFEFINRLSAEYYEWFYYDGAKLNFGKPDKLEEVALIYGRDLHSLQYAMQIAPLKHNKFAYNSKQDELLSSGPQGASGATPDLSHAISASNKVFSKVYNEPVNVRVNDKKEIDDFVNNQQKALISELVTIVGNGDNPMVGLGKILNVSMSVRGTGAFELQDFGKFLVTAVYHQVDGVGHYQNTFEGVTADTERIAVEEAEKPNPDMQLAIVTDNDDPQKQGRIKVQFKWQCTANDTTEWLRVVSPNAGHGDTGKNRGFLVVPEKGDQVLVGFEEGNIARPVIMGSVYHSNNVDSGGFTNSNIKGMTSRRGSNLTFDDGAHALTLATSAANIMNVQEQQGAVQTTAAKVISHKTGNNLIEVKNDDGSITLMSDQTITLKSGKSSITLHTDGTISIAGKTFNLSAQDNNITGTNNHIQGSQTKIDGGKTFIA